MKRNRSFKPLGAPADAAIVAPKLKHCLPAQAAHFASKIRIEPSGCWYWLGAKDKDGYGLYTPKGTARKFRAHRWSYGAATGYYPSLLDHVVCDTPSCVNPQHLKSATNSENILRGTGTAAINARKTYCQRGHELPPAVPGIRRKCWACQREDQAAENTGRKNIKLAQEQTTAILALRGEPITYVARKCGVSRSTVRRVFEAVPGQEATPSR